MNKKIVITVLLLASLALLTCLYLYINKPPFGKSRNTTVLKIDLPTAPEVPPPVEEKTLNLTLPQTPLLMDHAVELPDKQHKLHTLFEESQKTDAVSVGGRLLVDENPKPDASMRDKVKGAELGITIKTD